MSGHLGLGGEDEMKLQCPKCGSNVHVRLIFTGAIVCGQCPNGCTEPTERAVPVIIAWHCSNCEAFGEVRTEGDDRILAKISIRLSLPERVKLVVEEVTDEGAETT